MICPQECREKMSFFVAEASESESSSTNLEEVVDKQGTKQNEEDNRVQMAGLFLISTLDGLTDKLWCKLGADITDYFNYGFNERTWKVYSAMQKRSNPNYNKNAKSKDERREQRDGPLSLSRIDMIQINTSLGVTTSIWIQNALLIMLDA